ncbi:aspartate aminotransferase family protein [Mesorhizobium sp.]|uniref:aspartate aminotransferase family protein n=1 Tax=Mesorhizobium sp. TaxID=1871066 RepID=UPI0025D37D38|nr:aspartate aminotransferase family protein [Mesorhizobium sp.]
MSMRLQAGRGIAAAEGKRLSFAHSASAFRAASAYLAGGVSSNVRSTPAPHPLVIEKAEGAYVVDADGNRLIDYYGGMGPIILGHNDARIGRAVSDQLDKVVLAAGQSAIEIEAARIFCKMVPCAERVRFNISGTEADQAALRIARAATGRTKVIKFEGHYHGWVDSVLWSNAPCLEDAGSAENPTPVAGSLGMPASSGAEIVVLPWNDLPLLEARLRKGDIAAVIMEAAMCNAAAIKPREGYLEGARRVCSETGTILIFDEVITGFRVAPGGAQQVFGVTPDLAVFAKAIANGFPVAAVAGRADLMELCAKGVLHAGTYNAQPLCMAATLATLQLLQDGSLHDGIAARGTRMMAAFTEIFDEKGMPACVTGFPQVFHLALGVSEPARDWRDVLKSDRQLYRRFSTELLFNGVRALERGVWFLSAAHDDKVVDDTLEIVRGVVKSL